ncbi:cupin domain-containing protein [Microbacterium sp. P07]|uniref:(R)-mandelonitrile lyase n=1 Tax=Microbacterium sp. P07 TaxID=3366952 RepID=UPI0037475DC7
MTDSTATSRPWLRPLAVLAAVIGGSLAFAGCSTMATNTPTQAATRAASTPAESMTISPSSDRPPAPGPAEIFTGTVTVTPWSEASDSIPASTGEVAFEAGARSAWHSHPAGQTLIVTEGEGWIQPRGEARAVIHAGDVIWTPPGVEHWHGATDSTSMTHIPLTGVVDGVNAEWGDLVTDEEYAGTP